MLSDNNVIVLHIISISSDVGFLEPDSPSFIAISQSAERE